MVLLIRRFVQSGEVVLVCFLTVATEHLRRAKPLCLRLSDIKALNDWPQGKQYVFFPLKTLNVSRGEAKGNIEVEGKQNSLFPAGPVIKCFVIPPNLRVEITTKKSFALPRQAHLRRF